MGGWGVSRSVVSDSHATPRTLALQAPLSMGFSRQEYWSGMPYPSPTTTWMNLKNIMQSESSVTKDTYYVFPLTGKSVETESTLVFT